VDQLAAVPGCGRAGHRGDVVAHQPQPGQGAKLDCDAQHVARSAAGADERLISGVRVKCRISSSRLMSGKRRSRSRSSSVNKVRRTITARGVKQWTAWLGATSSNCTGPDLGER
jgi:hypothetical protein